MARRKAVKPGAMERTSVPGIYRRNGVYIARVYNSETKKRDDYTALTFEQAKQVKRDAERAKQVRKASGGKTMTVRQWAGDRGDPGEWLTLFPRAKESTMLHNRERARAFVRDFGDHRLDQIDPLDAHRWASEHPGNLKVVKAMFNDALKVKLISANPFEGVTRARSEGRRKIVVLTDAEIGSLVRTASRVWGDFGEQVFGPMIQVAAGTGMRPGELFALHAEDIDLTEGEVHVWRQFNGKTRTFTTAKTEAGHRNAPMLERAVRALREYEMPEAGPIWRTPREKPFKHRELAYYWPAVRAAFVAGLPESHHLARRGRGEIPGGKLDFYEATRHHYGTALARAGATPYEIAYAMGHEDGGKMAMDTYVHLAAEDARASLKNRLRAA